MLGNRSNLWVDLAHELINLIPEENPDYTINPPTGVDY